MGQTWATLGGSNVDNVLQSVIRLRRHHEREVLRDLAQAEQLRLTTERALEATNRDMEDTLGNVSGDDPADMARRHAHAIRLEMERRRQEVHATEAARRVTVHQRAAGVAARDKRVIELVAEAREAAELLEARRHEAEHLDQAGLQSWWRRR